jgi:hypothetical protein
MGWWWEVMEGVEEEMLNLNLNLSYFLIQLNDDESVLISVRERE